MSSKEINKKTGALLHKDHSKPQEHASEAYVLLFIPMLVK